MGVSKNSGTQQSWVFLLKMYHYFRKHPYSNDKKIPSLFPQKKHMHNANIHPFRCRTNPRLPDGDMILGTGNGLLTRISVRDPRGKPRVFFELTSELLKTVPVSFFLGGEVNPLPKNPTIEPLFFWNPQKRSERKGHQVIKAFFIFWGGKHFLRRFWMWLDDLWPPINCYIYNLHIATSAWSLLQGWYLACEATMPSPGWCDQCRFDTGRGSLWGLAVSGNDTPPKFNMEPENKSLEKESPFGNHDFQVPC